MIEPFNDLTPAEAERLAFLAEECGELVQAVCKILRHGYESANPLQADSKSNRANLTNEMGDVRAAMSLMCEASDVRFGEILACEKQKLVTVAQWMHDQP